MKITRQQRLGLLLTGILMALIAIIVSTGVGGDNGGGATGGGGVPAADTVANADADTLPQNAGGGDAAPPKNSKPHRNPPHRNPLNEDF